LEENAKLKKEIDELTMKLKVLSKDDIKECKKEKVKKEKVKEVKKEKVKEVKKEKVKELKKDKKKEIKKSEVVISLDFDKCTSKAMTPKDYATDDDEKFNDDDTIISNVSDEDDCNEYTSDCEELLNLANDD
jgi:hypothetical protein